MAAPHGAAVLHRRDGIVQVHTGVVLNERHLRVDVLHVSLPWGVDATGRLQSRAGHGAVVRGRGDGGVSCLQRGGWEFVAHLLQQLLPPQVGGLRGKVHGHHRGAGLVSRDMLG